MQFSIAAYCVLALATLPIVSAGDSETVPHRKLRQHRQHRHHHGRAHSKVKTAATTPQAARQAVAAEVVPAAPQSQVPVAVNAGPDGYPKLPAVSAMMGSSSQTLQSINEEARVLEARVVQTQMENEAKMARQKAVFEQKLKSQEDRSRAVVASNQRLSSEIAAIETNISTLQHHAQAVQAANEIMRSEMKVLEGKLARGRAFLIASLKNLDDSKAPQLAVLQELKTQHGRRTKQTGRAARLLHRGAASADVHIKMKRVREAAMQTTSDSATDHPNELSLLALGTTHEKRTNQPAAGTNAVAGSPQDLLNGLDQKVDTLQKEEHLSETKLRVMFLSNFKAGVKRYAALLAEQRKLTNTRKTLLAKQAELGLADERLQATGSALQQQLRSFGLFTQRLARLALAPTQEVPELLSHLPVDVDGGMQEPLSHA